MDILDAFGRPLREMGQQTLDAVTAFPRGVIGGIMSWTKNAIWNTLKSTAKLPFKILAQLSIIPGPK